MRPRTFGGLVLTVIETHTIMDDQFVRTDDPLHHFDCLFARGTACAEDFNVLLEMRGYSRILMCQTCICCRVTCEPQA
jgi:hypothetical protein